MDVFFGYTESRYVLLSEITGAVVVVW